MKIKNATDLLQGNKMTGLLIQTKPRQDPWILLLQKKLPIFIGE